MRCRTATRAPRPWDSDFAPSQEPYYHSYWVSLLVHELQEPCGSPGTLQGPSRSPGKLHEPSRKPSRSSPGTLGSREASMRHSGSPGALQEPSRRAWNLPGALRAPLGAPKGPAHEPLGGASNSPDLRGPWNLPGSLETFKIPTGAIPNRSDPGTLQAPLGNMLPRGAF